jgi:hypothetical protein
MRIFIFLLIFSPAILLTIIGFEKRQNNNKNANVYFILAAVYCLIGFGLCSGALL